MDIVGWTAVIAIATSVAALAAAAAAVGALRTLATSTEELRQSRLDRESDYFRKLTPFLFFDLDTSQVSGAPLAIEVYAEGGGGIFNGRGLVQVDTRRRA